VPSDPSPAASLASLRDAREHAIAELSDAFAHDVIGVEEFERRLTLLHRADSVAEVEQTVSDVSAASSSSLAPIPPRGRIAPAHIAAAALVQERQSVRAILGGVNRTGAWTPPHRLEVAAVLGGIVLDFREASLAPGVTEVNVVAFMGGVQIVVPPHLPVEVSGTAIMGGFDHVERVAQQVDPGQPRLRVSGLVMMGGLAVETRLVGESEIDAHRRRRGRREVGPGHAPMRLPEKGGR
jgi:hypothetical protein